MENTLLRMAIGAAAVFAFVALPSAAGAESVVPPGNSAATQYTETFPTPGGNAEVNSTINGGGGGGSSKGSHRSPEKVLGSDTARHLEEHGEEGEAVADLATEAAPAAVSRGDSGSGGAGKGERSGKGAKKKKRGAGKPVPKVALSDGRVVYRAPATVVVVPKGSSGVSGVLSHATGSSSGEMGVFLPLVLLAAPLCALLYLWRRRRPGQAAS
jgi:hypothetical protein